MTRPNKFMPRIQRTFRDLSQEEMADIERASLRARMGLSSALDWRKLLESKRVLIISEAGAGKTRECSDEKQELWSRGEPAFYLDLAQLAANDMRDLMSPDEEARYEVWLATQSDVATFFLDSIDELKLTLGSFETALKRLSKAIVGRLGRVRIVITSRPIPVDQELIRRYLDVPETVEVTASGQAFADIAMGRQQKSPKKDDKEPAPVWRNVALMPLSDEQIRAVAAIEGVEDPDALIADIRARNAEDFTRRPQDLIELCADWREHRRIRTHRDQVANNIRVKLKPRMDRHEPSPLSPDKALDGARRLALAALLTRKLTIRHNVEADRGGEPGTALDPAAILHDWTDEERETLLQRALFGFASYGRVRFHHRSVIEYLAAQCLHERLNQGAPIKAVKRLLFAETPQGLIVVRPSMRPVAAWLAPMCPAIFSEVREREPGVLIDYADPESLPLLQRIDVLRSYVCLHGQGGWRGLHSPRIQVNRFAEPGMANPVLALWSAGIENVEVRELLLELIGAGPMPECADLAYGVAADSAATDGERLHAIDALIALNDPRIDALTRSMAEALSAWPASLVRAVIPRCFPHRITPDRLCEILRHLRNSESSTSDLSRTLPQQIAELDIPPDYLSVLRAGLTSLVTEGLVWKTEWPHLESERPHLLSALAAVCARLIQTGRTNDEVLRSSVIALRLQREPPSHDEQAQTLRNVLAEVDAPIRERIFWVVDTFNESLHPQGDTWLRVYEAWHEGPLQLNHVQDGEWVHATLEDSSRQLIVRMMMLEISMRGMWNGRGDPKEHISGHKPSVADSPELISVIEQFLAPREISPEEAELNARRKRQREAERKLDEKHHEEWLAFWHEVAEHPDTAFGPDRESSTAWNLWQAMQRAGEESRASGWSRRFIEHHFGKQTADKLRNAMPKVWRADRPTLPSERPANERGTFFVHWQFGLAAIAAEAEDAGWARKLSTEEAELAARYVSLELNGFPSWLESLAREHPEAVERTLGPDLSAELQEVAGASSFAIQLQNVSYAPASVAQLFLPRLRVWLDAQDGQLREGENEAAALLRLERVLEILLGHGGDKMKAHIHAMAEERLKASEQGAFTLMWMSTLFRLNPGKGVDALERLSGSIEPEKAGPVVGLIGSLFGDRHGGWRVDLRSPGFTPSLLLRLVRLAYRHVRGSDDEVHDGPYSPGYRDSGQYGRNAVLGALIDAKGTDAWAAKLELAQDPEFSDFRDRMIRLAREKAAEEVDGAVFAETDVAALNRYGEAPPATRHDMFSVLVDRLDDLDDLLLQDVSPRAAWALIKDEKVMRRQITLQLRNGSNGVYTVDQEAVTAEEKETDVRLRVPSSSQQATIELKIGENCTGRQLRDAIRNQLVAKYMAAESCRAGCLLVTVADSHRAWKHPDTGEPLDVDGLRRMLEAEAANAVCEMGGCLYLSVKVLDLRPRFVS